MRIRHGKHILTSREQVEEAMGRQDDRIALLQKQLDVVLEWTRGQLALHQPYTHAIDVSCHNPENLAEAIAQKLKRDVWCARCNNPWPCRHIASLRLLRDAARRNAPASLETVLKEIRELPKPERREGQIDVML